MGHFGYNKTYAMLATNYYWPRMKRDVERLVQRCSTSLKDKSSINSHGLHTFSHTLCTVVGYIYGLCARITMHQVKQGFNLCRGG